jgi:hypothetical protein
MTSVWSRLVDVLRGSLIGAAEVVPGVSGGTIALITGVYDTLIGSAATIIRALVGSFRAEGRLERWREVARCSPPESVMPETAIGPEDGMPHSASARRSSRARPVWGQVSPLRPPATAVLHYATTTAGSLATLHSARSPSDFP